MYVDEYVEHYNNGYQYHMALLPHTQDLVMISLIVQSGVLCSQLKHDDPVCHSKFMTCIIVHVGSGCLLFVYFDLKEAFIQVFFVSLVAKDPFQRCIRG